MSLEEGVVWVYSGLVGEGLEDREQNTFLQRGVKGGIGFIEAEGQVQRGKVVCLGLYSQVVVVQGFRFGRSSFLDVCFVVTFFLCKFGVFFGVSSVFFFEFLVFLRLLGGINWFLVFQIELAVIRGFVWFMVFGFFIIFFCLLWIECNFIL